MQPTFSGCPVVSVRDDFSVCEDIYARGLCLPSDNKLEIDIRKQVIEIVRSCFT